MRAGRALAQAVLVVAVSCCLVVPRPILAASATRGTVRGQQTAKLSLDGGKSWLALGGRSLPVLSGTEIRSGAGNAQLAIFKTRVSSAPRPRLARCARSDRDRLAGWQDSRRPAPWAPRGRSAPHVGHLRPTGVRTRHCGQIGMAHCTQVSRVVPAYLRLSDLLERIGRSAEALDVLDDFYMTFRTKKGPHSPTAAQSILTLSARRARLLRKLRDTYRLGHLPATSSR